MSNKPSRNGKKWEEDEVTLLLQSIQDNKSMTDIAREHRRTPGAIESELRKIAYRFWQDEKSVEEIARLTSLSEEEVELAISRRQQIQEKKKEELPKIKDIQAELVSIRNRLNALILNLN